MVCKLPGKIVSVILVSVTGTGDSTNCYFTYNGTKHTAAGDFAVQAGDEIAFTVGRDADVDPAAIKINGSTVAVVTSTGTKTYKWTVPEGTRSISIALSYRSSTLCGNITVTTA